MLAMEAVGAAEEEEEEEEKEEGVGEGGTKAGEDEDNTLLGGEDNTLLRGEAEGLAGTRKLVDTLRGL